MPPDRPAGARHRIIRVGPALRPAAADRLVASAATGMEKGRGKPGKRFLTAAAAYQIDLTHFWASVSGVERTAVREAALLVPGTGRTAMLFCSPPRDAAGVAELAAVIDRACAGLTEVALAQALLEPGERAVREAALAAGFVEIGQLAYLRRPMPRVGEFSAPTSWPAGVSVTPWRDGEEPELARALEASYVDTLDCPGLCGMRETRDVITSHRGTGQFDPALWWLVRRDGAPEGAMLFNPCPEPASVELVYLGISPALRGHGLGRKLMELGLSALGGRSGEGVTCAVDRRNAPALRLYEGLGFASFGERIALVRPLRTSGG
jgi:ribosomal protein S18 acetylase RimI-like enzyme